jgi:RHS repeat-associated protein
MSHVVIGSARNTRFGRRHRLVLTLAVALAASVVSALEMPVAAAEPVDRPMFEQPEAVPHADVPLARRQLPPSPGGGDRAGQAWPAGDEAEVSLSATPRQAARMPVTLTASRDQKSTKDPVRVRLMDQAGAQRAGVTGVLLYLDSSDPLSTSVTVDYSSFRYAGGADFGSRLRLVSMPACATTTPEEAECQIRTPLPSRNDPKAQTVSADVRGEAGSPVVLAAVADASGPQGTFEASSLAPSGTWSVDGSSGGFSWSYPISLPPVAAGGGIAPKVALGYGSSGVDGRTSGTNNQPSWIGQGWDYTPGYIERTYRGCFNDEALPEAQRTGDLCWAGQIVTMNLGGQSVPLVYDGTSHTWHPAAESGARVELLPGSSNGVVNGEYWKVTTIDGTQYWFGRNGGPGYTNQELTNSAWTVPVYGPRAGDPCHNPAGFAQSSCRQAWRWNLDFVEDIHGAVTAYYYTPETNYYGANKGTAGVDYMRGGSLKRIDYGLRKVNDSIYGQTTPGQVVFDVAERCTPTPSAPNFDCDPAKFTAANASHWPDTPQDQQCLVNAVCNNHSPSFWTTKRLSAIKTQYNAGAGPVTVDTYQLTQSFPTIGDPELRLDKIVRTGSKPGDTALTLPPIEFTYQLLDNRVPGYNNQPAMAHWRLTNVATDTGSIIAITYSTPECAQENMPTDPANIDKLCFPVYWTTPYNTDPILDYFHKYVTKKVEVQDRNGLSPTQVTSYHYVGTPAWHFDDNELVKPKHRTYGQFRGYQQVEVRTGGEGDQKTLTRTTYYRGMDDDILPGGRSRDVMVSNSLGESVADNNLYAGQAHEVQMFEGDTGQVLSTAIVEQTTIRTTATRNRPGLRPLTADIVNIRRNRAVTVLAAGGTRTATTTYGYDVIGRKITTTESGTDLPDTCTTLHYADNTTTWIRDRISETITSQQACPAPGAEPSPVLSATRTYYDNSAALGEIPGTGSATRTDKATANTGGTLTFATLGTTGYDPLGRVTSATDANQRTTRTTYTPADGGIVSKIVITNPKNQNTTTELEPSRGLTTGSADVGNRRSDATYDALGRPIALWQPGRVKGQVDANVTYVYLQRIDGPLALTTKTLVDYGTGTNYVTKIDLFDAFGQLRQTQADDVSNAGGVSNRVVKDVFYDSHGWAVRGNNRYITPGAPRTTMISVGDSQVDDRTITEYDGAGRPVKATSYERLTKRWETRTIHGGDRTTVIPPRGGVTTTKIADIRGRDTEVRQYTAAPTVTGSVVSGGDYEPTTLRYDALGQFTGMTDAAGNQWTYGHDFLGRQTSVTDPDAGTSTSTYDLAGQLTSTTDARGQVLAYAYDVLGRKTAEHSGSLTGTKLAEWTYDTAPNGVGLPAYNVRYTPKGNYRTEVTRYNSAGLPADDTVQIPAGETGLAGYYKTTYSYSTTGLLRTVTPVAAGGLPAEDIVIDYDRYGQPKSSFGYNYYVSASTYTAYGEPAQYTLGATSGTGNLNYDYDKHTRAMTRVNLSVQQAWSQIDDLQYTRDPAGNVTKIVNVQGAPANGAPTRTQCFDYDALNRLTEAWTATDNCAAAPSTTTVGGVNPYWTSWTTNEIGLRQTEKRHAVGSGADTTTTYTYPESGENAVRPHALSSTTTEGPTGTTDTSYDYNAVGDVTNRDLPDGDQTLTWNENNRLASVTTPEGATSYVYDADGNQLVRSDPAKTTLYLPMQDIVRDSTTGTLTGTRYYTHNGGTVAIRIGGNNPRYVQSDLQGTAQVTVTTPDFVTTRRAFDPYGNPVGAGQGLWLDSRGFLNKPHNPATGLTDIGARKYDPTIGMFISVDPVLDTGNPQQWNPYAYSNNNPVTYSDPSGLFCDMCEFYYPDHPIIGADCPPCLSDEAEQQAQDAEDIKSGRNTDPKKQPSFGGRRLPTFDELKNRPGFHHYMNGGTYQEAISDWAKGICTHAISEDQEFCSIAKSYGLLERDPGMDKFMLLVAVGVVLAPLAAECLASALCVRIAGGALDSVSPEGAAFANMSAGAIGAERFLDEAIDLGRAACSFTGDTQVLMADGTTKPIEDIQVGDQVVAADPETGETGSRIVQAVWTHPDTVMELMVGDDAAVTTTEDHPFWNASDGEWQQAQQLDPGDHLLAADGRPVRVDGARADTIRPAVAYNLSVDDIHTYYVLAGDAPILVHNTCPHGGIDLSGVVSHSGKFPLVNGPLDGALVRRDSAGNITNYALYDADGNILQRVDLTGRGHTGSDGVNVPTPHVQPYLHDVAPNGTVYPRQVGVRPAGQADMPCILCGP